MIVPQPTHSVASVGTSATPVVTGVAQSNPDLAVDTAFQNTSDTAIVYLGGLGVTTSSFGWKLDPGNGIIIPLPATSSLYAIASASNTPLAILRVGRHR